MAGFLLWRAWGALREKRGPAHQRPHDKQRSTTFWSSDTWTTAFGTMLLPRPPPSAAATTRERMEFVQYQLDTLANRKLLNGLTLEPGPSNRMHGGVQSTVMQAKLQLNTARRSDRCMMCASVYCSACLCSVTQAAASAVVHTCIRVAGAVLYRIHENLGLAQVQWYACGL